MLACLIVISFKRVQRYGKFLEPPNIFRTFLEKNYFAGLAGATGAAFEAPLELAGAAF